MTTDKGKVWCISTILALAAWIIIVLERVFCHLPAECLLIAALGSRDEQWDSHFHSYMYSNILSAWDRCKFTLGNPTDNWLGFRAAIGFQKLTLWIDAWTRSRCDFFQANIFLVRNFFCSAWLSGEGKYPHTDLLHLWKLNKDCDKL